MRQAFSWVHTAFNRLQVANGGGRHAYYLNTEQLIQVSKWEVLDELILIVAIVSASCCFRRWSHNFVGARADIRTLDFDQNLNLPLRDAHSE